MLLRVRSIASGAAGYRISSSSASSADWWIHAVKSVYGLNTNVMAYHTGKREKTCNKPDIDLISTVALGLELFPKFET